MLMESTFLSELYCKPHILSDNKLSEQISEKICFAVGLKRHISKMSSFQKERKIALILN